MEKEDILEKVYETAKRYELKSGGCAQCTIAAIFDVLGVEDEGVFKAATGMADGVGLTGDGHCGALSGGTMAISYFFGRSRENFGNVMKQVKACILAKKLHDEFVTQDEYPPLNSDVKVRRMSYFHKPHAFTSNTYPTKDSSSRINENDLKDSHFST
jgi:C_GCAxxG_C_C family probable redox protein